MPDRHEFLSFEAGSRYRFCGPSYTEQVAHIILWEQYRDWIDKRVMVQTQCGVRFVPVWGSRGSRIEDICPVCKKKAGMA